MKQWMSFWTLKLSSEEAFSHLKALDLSITMLLLAIKKLKILFLSIDIYQISEKKSCLFQNRHLSLIDVSNVPN